MNEDAQALNVVYVASDRSERDQLAYMKAKHADWAAVPFRSGEELRAALKRRYGVMGRSEMSGLGVTERNSGLPSLLIVKPDGSVHATDGKAVVNAYAGGGELPAACPSAPFQFFALHLLISHTTLFCIYIKNRRDIHCSRATTIL